MHLVRSIRCRSRCSCRRFSCIHSRLDVGRLSDDHSPNQLDESPLGADANFTWRLRLGRPRGFAHRPRSCLRDPQMRYLLAKCQLPFTSRWDQFWVTHSGSGGFTNKKLQASAYRPSGPTKTIGQLTVATPAASCFALRAVSRSCIDGQSALS